MRPFLKWAGNKYPILERIKTLLPPGKRLIEPFVGSGALFLNSAYDHYLLTDANGDLINLYQQLQTGGQEYVVYCQTFFTPANNVAERFYELRAHFNQTMDRAEKGALFLYLNRHCYNGLCRYNSKGEFNVPFGRYAKPYFPAEELAYFLTRAERATFCQADFATVMASAVVGDVIYCDPPYTPLSETANFTSYSRDKFGPDEQLALAHQAEAAAQRGIPVLISNHDTAFIRTAYAGAQQIVAFAVQRFISCDGARRNKASELLALFASPAQ